MLSLPAAGASLSASAVTTATASAGVGNCTGAGIAVAADGAKAAFLSATIVRLLNHACLWGLEDGLLLQGRLEPLSRHLRSVLSSAANYHADISAASGSRLGRLAPSDDAFTPLRAERLLQAFLRWSVLEQRRAQPPDLSDLASLLVDVAPRCQLAVARGLAKSLERASALCPTDGASLDSSSNVGGGGVGGSTLVPVACVLVAEVFEAELRLVLKRPSLSLPTETEAPACLVCVAEAWGVDWGRVFCPVLVGHVMALLVKWTEQNCPRSADEGVLNLIHYLLAALPQQLRHCRELGHAMCAFFAPVPVHLAPVGAFSTWQALVWRLWVAPK